MTRIALAAGLFFLAPLMGEYLIGNVPAAELPAIIVLAPMYGGAALLIRELTLRTGRGWPTLVTLAAAYGLLQPSIIDQSLFNPSFDGHDFTAAPTYLTALGMDPGLLVTFTVGHTITSLTIPIVLMEALARQRATEPWLRIPGLIVTTLLFTAGSWIIYRELQKSGFHTSPAQLGVSAAVVALLVVAAFSFPRTRHPETEPADAMVGERHPIHGAETRGLETRGREIHSMEIHGADTRSMDTHGPQTHGAETHGRETRSAETRSLEIRGAESHSAESHSAESHSAESHSAGPRSVEPRSGETHGRQTHSANSRGLDTQGPGTPSREARLPGGPVPHSPTPRDVDTPPGSPRPALRPAPRPWLAGLAAALAITAYTLRPETWPGLIFGVAVLAAGTAVIAHWSTRQGWSRHHITCLAAGAAVTPLWTGFYLLAITGKSTTPNLIGQAAIVAAVLALMAAAVRATADR
ncbi:hypothetical protein [Herbidospora sp. RD11066]